MTELSHAAIGAAIGHKIGNPYTTVLLSILSHFVIDKIIHFYPKEQNNRNILIIIGYVLTGVFLYYIAVSPFENKPAMIAGALSGVLVDTIINGFPKIRESKLGNWHAIRQPHTTSFVFIFTDVIVITISVLILLKW